MASATNAGSYACGAAYSNQQGYDTSGSAALTINKAHLTVVADEASRTYSAYHRNRAGTAVINASAADLSADNYHFSNLPDGKLRINKDSPEVPVVSAPQFNCSAKPLLLDPRIEVCAATMATQRPRRESRSGIVRSAASQHAPKGPQAQLAPPIRHLGLQITAA